MSYERPALYTNTHCSFTHSKTAAASAVAEVHLLAPLAHIDRNGTTIKDVWSKLTELGTIERMQNDLLLSSYASEQLSPAAARARAQLPSRRQHQRH